MNFWCFKVIFASALIFGIFPNKSIVNAINAECKFVEFEWTFATEPIYYCEVQNRDDFAGDRQEITSITGAHEIGKNAGNVNGLSFGATSSITKFPSNAHKILKHLTTIGLVDSQLTEITYDDLKNFPLLKNLWLFNNQITHIAADTFKGNPKLEVILMDKNRISEIESNTFSGLSHLRVLNLEDNNLLSAYDRSAVVDLVNKLDRGECENIDNAVHEIAKRLQEANLHKHLDKIIDMIREQEEDELMSIQASMVR